MLQYKEEHIQCRYYANEHTAIFKRMRLTKGETLPLSNHGGGVLLHLASGSMEAVLGGFVPENICARRLLFLPHNAPFYGRAIEDLDLYSCLLPDQFPLCSRYDLLDLRQDICNQGGG